MEPKVEDIVAFMRINFGSDDNICWADGDM